MNLPVYQNNRLINPLRLCGCLSCANCKCKSTCSSLKGDAKGGTNQNPNTAGVRAQAFKNWISNTKIRTAGGQFIGSTDLVEFVQEVHKFNYDTVKKYLYPFTTPGIVQAIYNAGSGTKTQIENRMATDPEFKQKVQDVTKKVLTTGENVLNTVIDPIKGITTTVAWLPYIIVGGLALVAIFAFKNPGSVRTPRRISLT